MAKDFSKTIRNGLLTSYNLNVIQTNTPSAASARYAPYSMETGEYYNYWAKYADNVFDAEIQGLDYDNFYEWRKVKLRASAVVNPSAGENLSTAWQKILILDKTVDFIPIGAYVRFNNATWIVYNPDNIAASIGTAIVVRCNTTYNTLDYYGNVVKTPMYYAKGTILASSPYYMEYSATIDGYQHIVLQLNDVTKNITNNTRIILGKSAFGMYGVSDFAQEYTGDDSTCHILRADLRLQETLPIDDIVEHVADRGAFSFDIAVGGKNTMHVGDTEALTVAPYRNGANIESTEDNPLSYSWESSDESVATVDENGNVTALSTGNVVITCTLNQNTSIADEVSIAIEERESANYVDFISPIPTTIQRFEVLTVKAAYFEDGVQTEDEVQYSVTGTHESDYSASSEDGILTILTWMPTSLTVTASCKSEQITAHITVEGY